ncbi:hypothetical protein HD806DRAFT_518688 [Xylariaceae sp. AK1471]|nr:hypothetical protein HD806DRAFT_518688 [Xylariaceae sp. AK1471]
MTEAGSDVPFILREVEHGQDGYRVVAPAYVHGVMDGELWPDDNECGYVAPEGRKPSTVEIRHADHCLNVLREVLMCKAGISVLSYEWHNDDRYPLANFHIDGECRN